MRDELQSLFTFLPFRARNSTSISKLQGQEETLVPNSNFISLFMTFTPSTTKRKSVVGNIPYFLSPHKHSDTDHFQEKQHR